MKKALKSKQERYRGQGRLIDEIFYRAGEHAVLSDQMPPNIIISSDERRQLFSYLKSLKSLSED